MLFSFSISYSMCGCKLFVKVIYIPSWNICVWLCSWWFKEYHNVKWIYHQCYFFNWKYNWIWSTIKISVYKKCSVLILNNFLDKKIKLLMMMFRNVCREHCAMNSSINGIDCLIVLVDNVHIKIFLLHDYWALMYHD